LTVYVEENNNRLPICAGYLPSQQPTLSLGASERIRTLLNCKIVWLTSSQRAEFAGENAQKPIPRSDQPFAEKYKALQQRKSGLFPGLGIIEKNGASEGIRTLDIHLGKVTLYQTELRSLPIAEAKLRMRAVIASPDLARLRRRSVPSQARRGGKRTLDDFNQSSAINRFRKEGLGPHPHGLIATRVWFLPSDDDNRNALRLLDPSQPLHEEESIPSNAATMPNIGRKIDVEHN
jgi:hypothetical protein